MPRHDTPGRAARPAQHRLARAEQQVILLVAQGASNAQIAHTLGTTPGAVANRVAHLLEALGCATRRDIAIWAAHHLTA